MYTLTSDMKQWLQSLINLMQDGNRKDQAQNWLDTHDAVTDAQLSALEALFDGDLYSQCVAFVAWVKGGVRPGDPH